MDNFYYEGKRFKNGRISIRFSPEEIKEIAKEEQKDMKALELAVLKLDQFDCELISEAPECLGNFSWFVQFKCHRNLRTYHFTQGHLDLLMAGKTAKVYPF